MEYFNAYTKGKEKAKEVDLKAARAIEARRLRATGITWREIADILGYSSAAGAHQAAMHRRT